MAQKNKLINDPIHGYMSFEKWAVEFIDTPHFQRLRDIKQLGTTYYVFPSATHSRFEHSLGTAHLAYTLTKRLQEQQGIEKSDHDLECVTLAALCHDLGHGPYSHVFDRTVIPYLKPSSGWRHEKGSEMMVEHLFKELESCSVDLGTDDEKFIKALIRGDSKGNKRSPYLFDIVANERNSVDVDKFDYLARDCYHLGMKSIFDFSRLMQFSRVMDDQITYYHKECFNIYEMFHTRYSLHKKVYSHRVSGAIDYMIRDALVEANSYFKIVDAIENAEEYIQLNDSILNRIEYSVCEELTKSREIVKRIRRRKLYKFVDECLVPKDKKDHIMKMINECEIVSHQNDSVPLHEDDVIVDWQTLNYAKRDENPVDAVRFYNDGDVSFPIYRSNVSYLFPMQYEEYIVRIFARNPDKVEAIQDAFRKLAKNSGLELSQGFLKSGSRKRRFPVEDP
ncbi:HD phosphohydrolase domain-containing protein [Gigaspora margarita]|uniref:HD phosphohydrolase domain-containing protein n=1 Tax=Gigaspora margarita TaxID=4874 RepID=A0A8H4A9H5_GIGMA|nr:HD phosphohydrolase domain-containing protein [Gigaspora margarita]